MKAGSIQSGRGKFPSHFYRHQRVGDLFKVTSVYRIELGLPKYFDLVIRNGILSVEDQKQVKDKLLAELLLPTWAAQPVKIQMEFIFITRTLVVEIHVENELFDKTKLRRFAKMVYSRYADVRDEYVKKPFCEYLKSHNIKYRIKKHCSGVVPE